MDALRGRLPPEDRDRSPFSGWVRAHWEGVADHLLESAATYASPRHASVLLPPIAADRRSRRTEGLEGYARTFLLAAFRIRGAEGAGCSALSERYAEGLDAGTDPSSAEAWPAIRSRRQSIVEAASIALALFESRPWIWDSVSEVTRDRAVIWLGSIHGKECWPNNWLLFPVVVNAFLKSVGAPHAQDEIDRNLDLIDEMYRGDGWYSDGAGNNFDHYVGWGMHYYTLLWCRMDGDAADPARASVYRERARRFLEDYRFLFSGEGAPLLFGRSAIYRFATVAPLWAAAVLGSSPLPPGETRRVASGALRYFLDHGAVEDGVLTTGWHGEFRPLAQGYSGPASPYWASKAFLGLLAPAEDDLWTAREEPSATERGDFYRAMPVPGFLAWGTQSDGIVRVANHRSDHYPLGGMPSAMPLYQKLAYSTSTSPELAPDREAPALDSTVVLTRENGRPSVRTQFQQSIVCDRYAGSAHYPRERSRMKEAWSRRTGRRGIRQGREVVETAAIALGRAEIRIHRVANAGHCRVHTGGFAIAADEPLGTEVAKTWSMARRSDGLTSFAACLYGFSEASVQTSEGANAFGRYSATPVLTAGHPANGEAVYVALIALTRSALEPHETVSEIAAVDVRDRCVVISCRSGEAFFVHLGAVEPVDTMLAATPLCGEFKFARVSPDGTSFFLGADGQTGELQSI